MISHNIEASDYEEMSNMDFIDFEDILDRDYGPVSTPRRDEFERKVDKSVHAWQLGKTIARE